MMKKVMILFFMTCLGMASLQAQINGGEYFFDTDPGIGMGTALSIGSTNDLNTNLSIPTTDLTIGFHTLNIRLKDANNRWSIHRSNLFYVLPTAGPAAASPVVGYEYFFNTDPGIGEGVFMPISPAATVVSINPNIGVESLPVGAHVLGVRFRDEAGKWSTTQVSNFVVEGVFPVTENTTLQGDENTLIVFSESDFPFSDQNEGETLQSITIRQLPPVGTFYLDANGNDQFDNGEMISLDQTVPVAELQAGNLQFLPVQDEVGEGYATFQFTVSDGLYDSNEAIFTIDVLLKSPGNTLTAQALSSSEIRLSWQDNSALETGYEIWRSPDGQEATFEKLTEVPADAATFTDMEAAAGTEYFYRVRAVKN